MISKYHDYDNCKICNEIRDSDHGYNDDPDKSAAEELSTLNESQQSELAIMAYHNEERTEAISIILLCKSLSTAIILGYVLLLKPVTDLCFGSS
jgi:hypothetical protein